jgi:hypothetical protein
MNYYNNRPHKDRIYDRVQELIEGRPRDEDEKPMSREALTAKLADLIFRASELNFHVGMALGDLGIHADNYPARMTDLTEAMDNLDIPTI